MGLHAEKIVSIIGEKVEKGNFSGNVQISGECVVLANSCLQAKLGQ